MAEMQDFLLRSEFLGETRRLTVFFPGGATIRGPLPVVYCADGQAVTSMAAAVAEAIKGGKVAPVALVGVHSDKRQRARRIAANVPKLMVVPKSHAESPPD